MSIDGKGFINARGETLEEKPSFSESFRLRRCLIPANGFFEWKRTGREKRPYYIYSHDEAPMMFAGIWDTWRNRGRGLLRARLLPQRRTNWLANFTTECLQSFLPNFKTPGLVRK